MSRYREVAAKVDLPKLENRILDFWKEHRSFEKLVEQNRGKPAWSFLDGPITANNPMGVHHAWGRSYKDMFCRYNAMLGRELRYQQGFDCQGLWVEVEVEKELGFKSKRDIEEFGVGPFVERCKERAARYAAIQTSQSIRLGYWMDWNDSYYTMSEENNYTIWAFLKRCFENGWVYKGRDVMPWCGRCGTGLSQHEIATEGYRELTHVSPYVKFPLVGRPGESLLVWTTTPWTLSSNVAAAVHPEQTYVKVQQRGEIFYLLAARESILKEKGPFEVLERMPGSALVNWEYTTPFPEIDAQKGVVHRVIPWTEVSDKDGTGIVHIAPGCGKEDFELSKVNDLAVLAPLDELGNFLPGYGALTGKNAGTVAQEVIEALRERKVLYKSENYKHSYPVCWRCSSELLFRLVDEWFIRMGDKVEEHDDPETVAEKKKSLRYQIMDVAKQATWIPSYGLDREIDWLNNMHDWMISKKRYWGLALPIFDCPACGTFEVIGSREELKTRAVSGWEEFEGHTPHRPWVDNVKIACGKCGKTASRVKDVGNPWLDAGIVGFSTMKWQSDPEYWARWFPADLVTESFPGQFRNWFYSLLAMSTVLAGKAPFKTLFGYALMKAEDGREMHKSWGNSIEFTEGADKAGVDAMRWLFATHVPEQNLLFGYATIDDARRKFLTLWNVYSFFITYARVDEFDPRTPLVPVAERSLLDRWILGNLQVLVGRARKALEGYEVHVFMRHAERFIDELSTWYVRRSRRRFWKSEAGTDKLSAYQTLHEVLVTLIELLAPILPFSTEDMYQNLVRSYDDTAKESVHHRSYPVAKPELIDEKLGRTMEVVLQMVELGRHARQKAAIKVRQPLGKLLVSPLAADGVDWSAVQPLLDQVTEELNIKAVEMRADVADLVRPSARLDPKKAGPRLGKAMQKVLAAVKALTPEQLAGHVPGAPLNVVADGVTHTLPPEEFVVELAAKPGWEIASGDDMRVLVSTEITPELRDEGLVREVIRLVQDLRKTRGLDVSDRIALTLEASAGLKTAVERNVEILKHETLAVSVSFAAVGAELVETELDGEKVKVELARVASA